MKMATFRCIDEDQWKRGSMTTLRGTEMLRGIECSEV